MLNKALLVRKLAERSGVSRGLATDLVEALIDEISQSLADGKAVNLTGFGRFTPVRREARFGRNPKTGQVLHIPPRIQPRFVPGSSLKARLRRSERLPE